VNDERTCGDCVHWKQGPTDPTNLGAPKMGQCRAVPPVPVVVGFNQSVSGPQPMIQSVFPMLLEWSPACGMHKERGVLALKI